MPPTPRIDRALEAKERELGALLGLNTKEELCAYWDTPTLPHPAPAVGVLRTMTVYSGSQRVAIMQFTLFNIIMTQSRKRFYARRTHDAHLWVKVGEPPMYRDGTILPVLAARGQVFDLIPASAYHSEQAGTRCHRPESAISAAQANRAARDARLFVETQRTIAAAATPAPVHVPQVVPKQSATAAFADFLSSSLNNLPEDFYLKHPLRFDSPGVEVPLRSRMTEDAAPGTGRPRSLKQADSRRSSGESYFGPSPAEISPTGSGSTLSSVELLTPDPFPGIDGLDPRLISLLVVKDKDEEEEWTCLCSASNPGSRPNCVRPTCRLPRPSDAPEVQSRSALGDPGDWYCDYCGLCNWTRRAFCLRCCPLHPDNVEEAMTKGLVHFDDPIISLLGYGDKRSRALKRAKHATHCACFGPHHGTRCPRIGRAVPDELWDMYVESQEALRPENKAQERREKKGDTKDNGMHIALRVPRRR